MLPLSTLVMQIQMQQKLLKDLSTKLSQRRILHLLSGVEPANCPLYIRNFESLVCPFRPTFLFDGEIFSPCRPWGNPSNQIIPLFFCPPWPFFISRKRMGDPLGYLRRYVGLAITCIDPSCSDHRSRKFQSLRSASQARSYGAWTRSCAWQHPLEGYMMDGPSQIRLA